MRGVHLLRDQLQNLSFSTNKKNNKSKFENSSVNLDKTNTD